MLTIACQCMPFNISKGDQHAQHLQGLTDVYLKLSFSAFPKMGMDHAKNPRFYLLTSCSLAMPCCVCIEDWSSLSGSGIRSAPKAFEVTGP